MKNTYYAVTRKTKLGKTYYISQVLKCGEGCDLISIINRYHDIFTVSPCETRKEAEKLCDIWNEGYFKNGCYLYQADGDNKVYPAKGFCMC